MSPENKKIRIAVVEDNELYNHLLTVGLKSHIKSLPIKEIDFEVKSYTNPTKALEEIDGNIDIVFLDYFLGEKITGMDLLRHIKQLNPYCQVIIISQVRNTQTAILPLVEGATEFILKDASAITLSCLTAAHMIYKKLNYV